MDVRKAVITAAERGTRLYPASTTVQREMFLLTTALAMLAVHEPYLAYKACGERYDMGFPYGLAETQLALALHSTIREEIVASVIRILAAQGQHPLVPAH